MAWNDQIFRYCERGADPGFWAEPLNAVTNGAFILAAIAAAWELGRLDRERRSSAAIGLTALVAVIGVGSFLFHTYATRWSSYADTIPIGIFMLAYLAFALRALVRLPWIGVAVGIALFIAALNYAGTVQCRPGLLSAMAVARGPCLNGTVGYAPAAIALLLIGAWLAIRRHPAWGYLVTAGAVFVISMTFRTVDMEICASTRLAGRLLGTHFLWHTLNALTLYLLLLAAIRHGKAPQAAPTADSSVHVARAG